MNTCELLSARSYMHKKTGKKFVYCFIQLEQRTFGYLQFFFVMIIENYHKKGSQNIPQTFNNEQLTNYCDKSHS